MYEVREDPCLIYVSDSVVDATSSAAIAVGAPEKLCAYAVLTDTGRERLADARKTHLTGVRRLFLERFDERELESLGGLWQRVLPASGP